MPMYEHSCTNIRCAKYGIRFENYFQSIESLNPQCEICNHITAREISLSSVIWARPLSSYHDSHLEKAQDDGFWATRRDEKGIAHRHYIDSIQGIKEHARATGCISPIDLPNNITGIDGTGTKLETSGRLSEI